MAQHLFSEREGAKGQGNPWRFIMMQ
jgi:hypothetical protein